MYNKWLNILVPGIYAIIGVMISIVILLFYRNYYIFIPLAALILFLLNIIFTYKYRTSGASFEKKTIEWLKEIDFEQKSLSQTDTKHSLELKKGFFLIAFPTISGPRYPEVTIYQKQFTTPWQGNYMGRFIRAFIIRAEDQLIGELSYSSHLCLEFFLQDFIKGMVIIFKQRPKVQIAYDIFSGYGLREDFDIESNLFNRKYQVFCQDRKFAFKILDPLIVDFLNQEKGRTLMISGNSIIIKLPKPLTKEKLLEYLNIGVKFAKHIEAIIKA